MATATFGPLLRSLRQSAQLTIEELSHASGVSMRAIGDMERGVSRGPQKRTVEALAEALGLDDEQRAGLADAARAGPVHRRQGRHDAAVLELDAMPHPEEIAAELATAGFDTPDVWGDLAGAPYDAASETFAVVARRPDA